MTTTFLVSAVGGIFLPTRPISYSLLTIYSEEASDYDYEERIHDNELP